MDIKSFHNIYFIGIGGIGMSAIARYLNFIGANVYGYDKTSTILTRNLEKEGISIIYEDSLKHLPKQIDLVIYTPAIPADHKQFNFFLKSELPMIKRAEALGWISRSAKTIAVAGTHGKTTTSSMIAQLLKDGGVSFSAFLGGISYDLGSNYTNCGDEWVVVEADEYDRSFLQLCPEIAILLSMDPDHLDIYGDHAVMKEGYWSFIMKINPGGKFIFKNGLEKYFPENWKEVLKKKDIVWTSFGFGDSQVLIKNVEVVDGKFKFDFEGKGRSILGIKSGLPGRHNIENACAALTIGCFLNIDSIRMAQSLEEFKGIFRRFDRLYENKKIVYIDDYAHHPTELEAVITAVRDLYPDMKILVVFQPHLFSRTRDFSSEFANVLALVDELIMMDIYPAREKPIAGVTSETILSKVKLNEKLLINRKEEIIKKLRGFSKGVIMTLGAGDIDLLREPIIKMLKEND